MLAMTVKSSPRNDNFPAPPHACSVRRIIAHPHPFQRICNLASMQNAHLVRTRQPMSCTSRDMGRSSRKCTSNTALTSCPAATQRQIPHTEPRMCTTKGPIATAESMDTSFCTNRARVSRLTYHGDYFPDYSPMSSNSIPTAT